MSRALNIESLVLAGILRDLAEVSTTADFVTRLNILAEKYRRQAKEISGDPISADFHRLPSMKDGMREAWQPRHEEELIAAAAIIESLSNLEAKAREEYATVVPTRPSGELVFLQQQ